MRLAILFSGQGGQQPEHLARLRTEAEPDLAEVLAATIPELWHDNLNEVALLSRNRQAQPMIFGYQMTLWRQLQHLIPKPVCVAGYSLGEMAACCVAGAFTAIQGVSLCGERARVMDEAFPEPAGLLAIIGLSEKQINELANRFGLLLAIRNGPSHVVLGGRRSALSEAEEQAAQMGATRTVALAVATPSHTPLLSSATNAFRNTLAPWNTPGRLSIPVLSAVDGRAAYTRPESLEALARQISTPLDWASCMSNLLEMQPDQVLELGPGNALTRMLEEMAPGRQVRSMDDFRSIAGIQKWLGASRQS